MTDSHIHTVINHVYRVEVYHIPCCTPPCDLIHLLMLLSRAFLCHMHTHTSVCVCVCVLVAIKISWLHTLRLIREI